MLFGFPLFGAGTAKDVGERLVALVAGVLKDGTRGSHQGNLAGPWLGERRRIVDREAVQNRIRVDPGEPFDDVQVLVGSAESSLAGQIGRIDHQSLSLPM